MHARKKEASITFNRELWRTLLNSQLKDLRAPEIMGAKNDILHLVPAKTTDDVLSVNGQSI